MELAERLFHLRERGTTAWRELLGGLTTFMALSYIIFVQPAILGGCGTEANPFPKGGIFIATCVASALACVLMGLLANYPIALAPAMGHNVYFAAIVCGVLGYSWQQGLAAVFIGGCVFVLLSFFGFRARIMEIIPDGLKRAIAAGIGLLLTLVGLEYAGLVVDAPGILLRFGDIQHRYTLLALFGLTVTLALLALRVRGAILLGIVSGGAVGCLATALGYPLLDFGKVQSFDTLAASQTMLKFDFAGLFTHKGLWEGVTVILTFLFLDVFDTIGTLVGVSERAGLLVDGRLPRARWALFSDASGTVLGSMMGTSTITSYVESAAGVQAGARTGLANMATAACFLLAILLYPFLGVVSSAVPGPEPLPGSERALLYPVIAPALIVVGSMMLVSMARIDWDDPTELLPAFLTIALMGFAVSITEGIAFGFISYSLLKLVTGRARETHWGFHLVSAALVLRYVFLA